MIDWLFTYPDGVGLAPWEIIFYAVLYGGVIPIFMLIERIAHRRRYPQQQE